MSSGKGALTGAEKLNGILSPKCGLRGTINAKKRLAGKLSGNDVLTGNIAPPVILFGKMKKKENLTASLSTASDHEMYKGEYVVDAKAHSSVILPTKNKAMAEDVTVNKVRLAQTSNLSGGVTVYIAEE